MQPNNNSGSFMSGPLNQPGMGPELQSLIGQSPNSGQGAPTTQNSTTPGGPNGVNAPTTQALPQAMTRPGGAYQTPTGAPLQQGAPELSIALGALANYVASHGKSHEANNDVPRKTAEAKLIASQIPQQGGS